MAPLTIDADLAKVVGKEPLPRTEIIKKMWEYIRANNLQDQKNKRMINADNNLKTIFDGKDQASMFELAKFINNHVKK
jgi:upstream activation factor subunit UAF30